MPDDDSAQGRRGEGLTASTLSARLSHIATLKGVRALAWDRDQLYASRGYRVLRARITGDELTWEEVGAFSPSAWRSISSTFRLTSRLTREGFHSLVAARGSLVAAAAGNIVRIASGESQFTITHKVRRGTRPLHFAVTPSGTIYWGEYFRNTSRDEVHIYGSSDEGKSWHVAHTFEKGAVRHIHNIVYDRWQSCLWILTGDVGDECRIIRASTDLKTTETVLQGNQQARAVALVPSSDGIRFSSDTPFEQNFIYHLDRTGRLTRLTPISNSSIYGCSVGSAVFFSAMVEPSRVNRDKNVRVFACFDGSEWSGVLAWQKDFWHKLLFQYGNAFLPDGPNLTDVLAVSTTAVRSADLTTTLWRVHDQHDAS
jgi:hypothetical protein